MNPVKAPIGDAIVVTGYCRPSGQDCFSAALHTNAAVQVAALFEALYRQLNTGHWCPGGRFNDGLQVWDRNRVFPQVAALIDRLRDLNRVFPRGFSSIVIQLFVARRDARLSGCVPAMLGYLAAASGDLEHGKHSGHRTMTTVRPAISQV